jgi:ParB-like chromosome segregation protein Spo0J
MHANGNATLDLPLSPVPIIGRSDLGNEILSDAAQIFERLGLLEMDERIKIINELRQVLATQSPFNAEPVDCVQWVKAERVFANDYNPNSVAPPEMKLLARSIMADGYTQPIVTWPKGETLEVVDGFHRNRVGKESPEVRERIRGYLPVVVINQAREDLGDRMAATIRHNRARGEHRVDSMADIVIELKRRFWSDEKIGNELGMDADEVLRLTQVTGLAALFADRDFSEAWEATTPDEVEGVDLIDAE